MKEITLEELLEAGCHFGHQVIRSNPKARDFVFDARDNIQIIDLGKTKEGLEDAVRFIKDLASNNGTLLIVGTKRQAQGIVLDVVTKARAKFVDGGGLYFINSRWIGGVLTNFAEISKNIKKLKDLEQNLKDEEKKAKYTKKEIGEWEKKKQTLERLYGGIVGLKKNPSALFIIDSNLEEIAVKEALRMGVPSVAIVDTNADPFVVDYPIPANDDAVGSIELILSFILDAWEEGKKNLEAKKSQKEGAEATKEEIVDKKPKVKSLPVIKAVEKKEKLKVEKPEIKEAGKVSKKELAKEATKVKAKAKEKKTKSK
ncbi:30S ribosomal protein S2 [Patescibacteria group bacterium]|nr:30S ribosomal protein S2 [Patescibacteria group bacterium]